MTDAKALLDQLETATVIGKGAAQALALVRGITRIAGVPHWSALGRPLEGRTVYVVGAGPSLDKNVGLMKEYAESGGTVFAVNTSGPALVRAGVPIDVLVTLETVPIGSHLASCLDATTIVALDLTASREAWEVTRDHRRVWFTGPSPDALEVCAELDVPPVLHGGAAVTAATMLAYEWGAEKIVLLGHDLAYSGEQAYATGSGWEGLSLKREGDRLVFEGRADRDEAHRAAGVPAVPRDRPTIEVPSWDGTGTVRTVLDYWAMREWYGRQGHLRCERVNATEGGCQIEGWRSEPLRLHGEARSLGAFLGHVHREATATAAEEQARLVTAIRSAAARTERMAWKILGRESPRGEAGLIWPSHAVEFHAQGPQAAAERAGLPPAQRIDLVYQSYVLAAQEIRQVLREETGEF